MLLLTYFVLPSAIDTVKGIWPWIWGILCYFWPLWALLIGAVIVRELLYKFGYFVDKKLEEKKEAKTMKKCPQCTEMVPIEAKKCKFCGSDV